ncbi:MAG: poly-beta-1,6-N-acetyl-D-glucosamine N-deacetylase PgaB [Candidatus Parcubacteria bacterium]|nr:poly-beta-1,6-N-acetyl-D-glucosamine N-deacetylase PgaB [Burkholderiales bacterium]
MKRLLAMFLLALTAAPAFAAPDTLTILCYHEARDDVRDYPDPYAVDSEALVRQFAWLRANGYTPVKLDEVIAARQGGKPLPPKAVLLTFDDSYLSFHTRVYPLLRAFNFPAVLGVVGKWIGNPPSSAGPFGEKSTVPEASFTTWNQLREMTASGLVEIASHSYDLHRGVPGNPQGNLQPAATSRIRDAATGGYESDAVWRARIREDLARNSQLIESETGRRPRVVVWPYGSYNEELVRIAGELGMPVALTLNSGFNTPEVPLNALRRVLIEHNPSLGDFALAVRGPVHPEPLRLIRVSLDRVYSADAAQQELNLSRLLDRIKLLNPSHVVLQATADLDGDGVADATYFPTQHLPLRADLLNRVAWQLATRSGVVVFAALQVTATRLTENQIADTYEDLARHSSVAGLLFSHGSSEFTQRAAERARRWRAPLKVVREHADESQAAADHAADYVVLPGAPRDAAPSTNGRFIYLLPAGEGRQMAREMRALQLRGALNFGYGGDDYSSDLPPLRQIAPALSLRTHPN